MVLWKKDAPFFKQICSTNLAKSKGLDTKRFMIQVLPVASVYELGAELFG